MKVLVIASRPADARLATDALAELGVLHLQVEDAVEAMQALCRRPHTFSALVVGEEVGRASGLTLCGLARDAACRLPILLLTADRDPSVAARAARLRVTVLWQPTAASRVLRALHGMLPRHACTALA